MEWVASTLHTTLKHGASIITTDDAHTSAASSRLNWPPRQFQWNRLFRRKTKPGFCVCAITFQTPSTCRMVSAQCGHSAVYWKLGFNNWKVEYGRGMLVIIVRLLIVALTQKRSLVYNFDNFDVMNIKPDAAAHLSSSASLSLKCHMTQSLHCKCPLPEDRTKHWNIYKMFALCRMCVWAFVSLVFTLCFCVVSVLFVFCFCSVSVLFLSV
jgi:hypothetical protein